MCAELTLFWEKESITDLLFLCPKDGPQRKDFGGRYGLPVFFANRAFVSTTGLESFSLRPESSPKAFLSVVVVYAFSSLIIVTVTVAFSYSGHFSWHAVAVLVTKEHSRNLICNVSVHKVCQSTWLFSHRLTGSCLIYCDVLFHGKVTLRMSGTSLCLLSSGFSCSCISNQCHASHPNG